LENLLVSKIDFDPTTDPHAKRRGMPIRCLARFDSDGRAGALANAEIP